MTTELIQRTTLTEMVNAWRQGEADITAGFALLKGATDRLKAAFQSTSYRFGLHTSRNDRIECDRVKEVLAELKKEAWAELIEKMGMRRVLSIARRQELDRQLESGEGLPEIDEVQILAMMDGALAMAGQYVNEAVLEVFEYLRPHCSGYKTNSELEIGPKVILGYAVESNYNRHASRFQVNYHRRDKLRAIDNVFHALAGQGTVKSHQGPLVDSIGTSPASQGETEFFRWKGYKNCNLHLEFRRLDLLAKFNQIAGGLRLKPQN